MFNRYGFNSIFTGAGEKQPNQNKTQKQRVKQLEDWGGQPLPKVLVIDDDPLFCLLMERVARHNGAKLSTCQSVSDLSELNLPEIDVAVIDYDLGNVTGDEIAAYLESFTKNEIPVILVSHSERRRPEGWPKTIQEFIHKKSGPYAILNAVAQAHAKEQYFNKLNSK